MSYIDTHAHIYAGEFDEDRRLILQNSDKEGVKKILQPAIDSSTHAGMLQAETDNPGFCISMMGVHPCSIKADFENELRIAREWFEKRSFIAVGETGLDYYWDLTFKTEQLEAFNRQIEWAIHYDIPVVIHSRNSTDECIQVIRDHQKGSLKGVFHCFSGNIDQARQIMKMGFYLGIGGVLTFKNSGLDKVLQEIDLDYIVLETDAPYLAPVPFRGKRNQPSYIRYIAAKLAEIKKLSLEDIETITNRNAKKLFQIPV